MNQLKRRLWIILCISTLLSLAACGQAETTPTQITAGPAEQTQAAVDACLAMAQDFLDKEDFDSAVAVLEQAKETSEDGRIEEMLLQIERLRPIPLDVVVSMDGSGLKSGTVEIHSVAASQRYDGFVRFVIDYTATEGMYLQVEGVRLDYTGVFRTTGTRDSFRFEISAADLRSIGREIQVRIARSDSDMFVMGCVVNWPGESRSPAVEIPLRQGSLSGLGGCEILGVRVHGLDETRLYYNVDYTAPRPGMYVTVSAGDEAPFYDGYTDQGRRQFAFIADRTAVEASGVLHLTIRENEKSQSGAAVEMHLDDYELPPAVQPTPMEPARELDYAVWDRLSGESFQVCGCRARLLSNGFVHYQIEYHAEESVGAGAHGFPNGSTKSYPVLGVDGAASGTAEIYVPLEDIQDCEEVIVALGTSASEGYYELNIPNSWLNAVTEGSPVGETVELPFDVNENPDGERFAFHSCTAQRLDNGHIRFSISYDSPEHLLGRIWYNTTRYIGFASGAKAGSQSVVMDIPAEDIRYSGDLTFLLDLYLDKNGKSHLMEVNIDAASVMGDLG